MKKINIILIVISILIAIGLIVCIWYCENIQPDIYLTNYVNLGNLIFPNEDWLNQPNLKNQVDELFNQIPYNERYTLDGIDYILFGQVSVGCLTIPIVTFFIGCIW